MSVDIELTADADAECLSGEMGWRGTEGLGVESPNNKSELWTEKKKSQKNEKKKKKDKNFDFHFF